MTACICGHPEGTHRHYRPGTDCGKCNCGRYHPGPSTTARARALLAFLLSPLRREWKATRLADPGRPTIAEVFRDGRVKAAPCIHGRWEVLHGFPVCAQCGAKLE